MQPKHANRNMKPMQTHPKCNPNMQLMQPMQTKPNMQAMPGGRAGGTKEPMPAGGRAAGRRADFGAREI